MIKLSVIVPVYNVEKYLPRCLDSLVNQTLKDIEIICVNDGSTDKSLKILEKYAEKDSRFKIINQNNSGLGNARNAGMNIAKGDYIAFVDSDDWTEIDAFEYLYNTAVKVNANILMFNNNVVSDINTVAYSKNDFIKKVGHDLDKTPYFITKELKENIFEVSGVVWDKIYKRKFIEDNNIRFPNVYRFEDFIFTMNACYFGEKVYYVDKCFYNYYQRKNSLVHLYFDPSLSLFDAVLQVQEFFDKYFPELSKKAKDYNFQNIVYAYLGIARFDFKTRRKFKKKYLEVLGNENFERFIKEHKKPFYCQIFSIKNNRFYMFKRKEITILGFKFMFEKKIKINDKSKSF